MKNITPPLFACGLAECPGVFDLEDGTVAVQGELMSQAEREQNGLPACGPAEASVKLPKALFEALFQEWSNRGQG